MTSQNKALTQTRRQRLNTKANAGGEYSSTQPLSATKNNTLIIN
jgi:hypothetical protein